MSDQNLPPNQPAGQQPPPPGGQPPPPQQPMPPQAPQAPQPTGTQFGDLANRFFAKLIDWVILGVVYAVVIVPLTIALAFGAATGGFNPFGGFSLGGIVIGIITYGIAVAYFALLESNRGQTLGKMLLKLKVVGPDGNNPTLEQALKRNAYILVSIVPFLGGLAYFGLVIYIAITINNNAQRNGFHDDFAGGTRVIKIG